jgi:hypothetical protein
MNTRKRGAVKRIIFSLAAVAALSGCAVYGPPYPAYDSPSVAAPYYYPYDYYPYGYGYPAYVGPALSLNFGYYHDHYRGGSSWRGHGWGGRYSGYSGYRGGSGGYRGGWRGRR